MCTRLTVPAASRMTLAPVRVEPVTEISATSSWRASAPPTSGPGPGTTLSTPRRQAGVERQAAEHERGQRRQLRRLEHDRVAGRERRPDLPGRHVERVVPGRDRGADADRLAPDRAGQALEVLARGLALEVAGGGGEEAQVVDRQRDVEGARELQRLAGVARLGARELVGALLEQVGHAVEHGGALAGGDAAPVAAPEGGAGGRDGALGVGRRGVGDLGERLAGRRVAHGPRRRRRASCPSISSARACALSAMDILTLQLGATFPRCTGVCNGHSGVSYSRMTDGTYAAPQGRPRTARLPPRAGGGARGRGGPGSRAALGARDRDGRPERPAQGRRAGAHHGDRGGHPGA